jgi:hypothetical protein
VVIRIADEIARIGFPACRSEWARPSWEVTILWALLALIFPLLSQWLIEKREV